MFWKLLDGMQRTGKDTYETWNQNIPVLLLSGTDDPVGDMGKGMQRVTKKMKAHGMENVKLELIPMPGMTFSMKYIAAQQQKHFIQSYLVCKYIEMGSLVTPDCPFCVK